MTHPKQPPKPVKVWFRELNGAINVDAILEKTCFDEGRDIRVWIVPVSGYEPPRLRKPAKKKKRSRRRG